MKNKKRKILRYLGIALIVIGILIISYPLYTNLVMKRREADVMNSWENLKISGTTAQTGTAETTAGSSTQITDESGNIITEESSETLPGETASGGQEGPFDLSTQVIPGATFKITIPKINSSWVGYEGTNIPSLKRGPGHYIGTAKPGQLGTCVIAGHRTTYGAPFNRINELAVGDQIILETLDNKQFTYLVTGQTEVLPNDLSLIYPTSYPSLILTSCTPKYHATRRLLVFAKLAE
jgi:LPXTG-site transpeptidase (sortase) family protein